MIARCFTFAIVAISCAYWPCLDRERDLRLVAQGNAVYYDQGVFDDVLANKGQEPPPEGSVIGYAALNDPAHIGSLVWIVWPDGDMDGPYLVVDCARATDLAYRAERNVVVDVDRNTARRHAMRGPVEVRVYEGVEDHSR